MFFNVDNNASIFNMVRLLAASPTGRFRWLFGWIMFPVKVCNFATSSIKFRDYLFLDFSWLRRIGKLYHMPPDSNRRIADNISHKHFTVVIIGQGKPTTVLTLLIKRDNSLHVSLLTPYLSNHNNVRIRHGVPL